MMVTKLNPQAEAALKQPDTRVVSYEMTDGRRERFKRVSTAFIDLLKAHTEGPVEAYLLLQFIREAFEHTYDIRGGIIVEKETES